MTNTFPELASGCRIVFLLEMRPNPVWGHFSAPTTPKVALLLLSATVSNVDKIAYKKERKRRVNVSITSNGQTRQGGATPNAPFSQNSKQKRPPMRRPHQWQKQ